MSGKRQFPFHSEVQGFELQRRKIGDSDKDGPKVWQSREQTKFDEYDTITGDVYAAASAALATDFVQWSEAEVRAFLDQWGEDCEDCQDFIALVARARECEANTGPAQKPDLAAAGQQNGRREGGGVQGGDEGEVDPLDAFMAEIGQIESAAKPRHERVEADDNAADFMEARRKGQLNTAYAAAAAAGASGYDSGDEGVYKAAAAVDAAMGTADDGNDSDDAGVKKDVESLAALEHEGISYAEFNKDFYDEAPEITALTHAQVADHRRQLGMRVSGFDAPRPILAFQQCGFDGPLMAAITKAGYQQPTAIQSQALPAALSGRDVLGIAKTGSGKTAAFVLPMIVHIMDQPELQKGEGPIGVIVAPTRELAEQIHKETRRFSKAYSLGVAAAFGGLSKHQQFKDLKAGCEVAVCTPGRMIDLIRMKACTMKRATYLVFDEADRMFDMGFEPQVRSIMGQIRPDRQTLLFSATMPRKVERLAGDALTSPVRITVGEVGGANEDIKQVVEVVHDLGSKQKWLLDRLQRFIDDGDVLVFANQKARVDELAAILQAAGAKVASIHGDMDQHTRMHTLADFKAGAYHALVATDVAARGLDIKSIKTVVNYDAAKDIDTHVHRIGRTGRAGDKDGVAYTLLLPHETRMAGDLVQNLAAAGQEVPAMLHELAARDPRFGKGTARGKGGRGGRGRGQVGGAGLGFGGGGGGGGGRGIGSGGGGRGRGSAIPPPVPSASMAAAAAAPVRVAVAAKGAGGATAAAPTGMAGFARSHGGEDAHFASGGTAAADAAAAAAARASFASEAAASPPVATPIQEVAQQAVPQAAPHGFAAAAAAQPVSAASYEAPVPAAGYHAAGYQAAGYQAPAPQQVAYQQQPPQQPSQPYQQPSQPYQQPSAPVQQQQQHYQPPMPAQQQQYQYQPPVPQYEQPNPYQPPMPQYEQQQQQHNQPPMPAQEHYQQHQPQHYQPPPLPPLPGEAPHVPGEAMPPQPEANTVAAARAEQQAASLAARRQFYNTSLQTGFVSSGTRQADVGAKPEIVMPKNFKPQGTVPPPPVPVTQQPLYLQRQQPGWGRGGGSSYGGTGGYGGGGYLAGATPAAQTAVQSASVQAAIEQARAVAARLAAQAPGAQAPTATAPAPGGNAAEAAMEQARAIAARLAAQAPGAAAPAAAPAPSNPSAQAAIEQARAIAARLAAQAPGGGGNPQQQYQWGGS